MKETSTMIKTGLVALLLSATASVFGQSAGTIDKDPLSLGPFSDATADNRVAALGASLVPAYETECRSLLQSKWCWIWVDVGGE